MQITPLNNIYIGQKNNNENKKNPSFGNFVNVLSALEAVPMLDVALKDLASAILPRTLVDGYTTNWYNGAETFRRESSGLVQNCLLPSWYAVGIGLVLHHAFGYAKGEKGMSTLWASEESIDKFSEFYKKADGVNKTKSYLESVLKDIEGLEGNAKNAQDWKSLDEKTIESVSNKLERVIGGDKESKKLLKESLEDLVANMKAESTIHFKSDKGKNFGSDLSEILRDVTDLGKRFVGKNNDQISLFTSEAKKLLRHKSYLAMPLILLVSASLQLINRLITKKSSGIDGVPIYKDFGKNEEVKPKEDKRKGLIGEKLKATGLMLLMAFASTGFKKPTMQMFHFKGKFPTMNQCRYISAATFIGRFWASGDSNELNTSKWRDLATFASFYFLGDIIAKVWAKKAGGGKDMFNVTGEAKKSENFLMNSFYKAKHWINDVKIKTFKEAQGEGTRKIRARAQVANLGITTLLLGVLIPFVMNHINNKKRQEEIKSMKQNAPSSEFFNPSRKMYQDLLDKNAAA